MIENYKTGMIGFLGGAILWIILGALRWNDLPAATCHLADAVTLSALCFIIGFMCSGEITSLKEIVSNPLLMLLFGMYFTIPCIIAINAYVLSGKLLIYPLSLYGIASVLCGWKFGRLIFAKKVTAGAY